MPLFRTASTPRSVHHAGSPSGFSSASASSAAAANVCYGGPLGALLSISSSSSGGAGGAFGGSAPASRRGSFRHSNSAGSGFSNSAGNAQAPFMTPQSTRKHSRYLAKSSESVDSSDSGRGSSQAISDTGTSVQQASGGGLSRSRPGSYHGSALSGASASSEQLDYKRLYEKEKAANERLTAENGRLREENEALKRQSSEQRQIDKRLSEYEAQNRSLEQVMRENEKLKAENRALARVVARLSRQ